MLQHTSVYSDARDNFHIEHIITLIDKQKTYCDFYHFGGLPNNKPSSELCINNLDMLKTFIFYFKDKGKRLIEDSDIIYFPDLKNKIANSLTDDESLITLSTFNKEDFLDELDIKRFYLGERFNDIYLTPKELSCVKLAVQGKTAQEISEAMYHSRKTIEAHLEHVKQKLNCSKLSQLIYKLASSDLSKIIFNTDEPDNTEKNNHEKEKLQNTN